MWASPAGVVASQGTPPGRSARARCDDLSSAACLMPRCSSSRRSAARSTPALLVPAIRPAPAGPPAGRPPSTDRAGRSCAEPELATTQPSTAPGPRPAAIDTRGHHGRLNHEGRSKGFTWRYRVARRLATSEARRIDQHGERTRLRARRGTLARARVARKTAAAGAHDALPLPEQDHLDALVPACIPIGRAARPRRAIHERAVILHATSPSRRCAAGCSARSRTRPRCTCPSRDRTPRPCCTRSSRTGRARNSPRRKPVPSGTGRSEQARVHAPVATSQNSPALHDTPQHRSITHIRAIASQRSPLPSAHDLHGARTGPGPRDDTSGRTSLRRICAGRRASRTAHVARILAVAVRRAGLVRLAHLPPLAGRLARGVRDAVAVGVAPLVAAHLRLHVQAVVAAGAGELAGAARRRQPSSTHAVPGGQNAPSSTTPLQSLSCSCTTRRRRPPRPGTPPCRSCRRLARRCTAAAGSSRCRTACRRAIGSRHVRLLVDQPVAVVVDAVAHSGCRVPGELHTTAAPPTSQASTPGAACRRLARLAERWEVVDLAVAVVVEAVAHLAARPLTRRSTASDPPEHCMRARACRLPMPHLPDGQHGAPAPATSSTVPLQSSSRPLQTSVAGAATSPTHAPTSGHAGADAPRCTLHAGVADADAVVPVGAAVAGAASCRRPRRRSRRRARCISPSAACTPPWHTRSLAVSHGTRGRRRGAGRRPSVDAAAACRRRSGCCRPCRRSRRPCRCTSRAWHCWPAHAARRRRGRCSRRRCRCTPPCRAVPAIERHAGAVRRCRRSRSRRSACCSLGSHFLMPVLAQTPTPTVHCAPLSKPSSTTLLQLSSLLLQTSNFTDAATMSANAASMAPWLLAKRAEPVPPLRGHVVEHADRRIAC